MKGKKIVMTNDDKTHFSDILISQSLDIKHFSFKHLYALQVNKETMKSS